MAAASSEERFPKVIVTGAGNSVGFAIARQFALTGAVVHACDIDQEGLSQLSRDHSNIITYCMDVCDSATVDTILPRALKETYGADVLVNTVGLAGPRAPIEQISNADWEATIRGSAGAAFNFIRHVIPYMKKQKSGVIINFSSCSTKVCPPYRSPYIAAKFAVEGLTLSLARELGPYNIRVNAILPGAIDNERLSQILTRAAIQKGVPFQEVESSMLQFISMRTKVSIDDIAKTVAFLASPPARHITGQLLCVDGNVEWEE